MNILEQLAKALEQRTPLAGSDFFGITRTEREVIISTLREFAKPPEVVSREAIIRECWAAIDKQIVRGEIADSQKHEWRNGMVLAANILAGMMGWPKAKYAEELPEPQSGKE